MEGFLKKRCANIPVMTNRYCEIDPASMSLYSYKNDLKQKLLSKHQIKCIGEWTGKGKFHTYPNAFTIETTTSKLFHCSAPTPEEKTRWLNSIILNPRQSQRMQVVEEASTSLINKAEEEEEIDTDEETPEALEHVEQSKPTEQATIEENLQQHTIPDRLLFRKSMDADGEHVESDNPLLDENILASQSTENFEFNPSDARYTFGQVTLDIPQQADENEDIVDLKGIDTSLKNLGVEGIQEELSDGDKPMTREEYLAMSNARLQDMRRDVRTKEKNPREKTLVTNEDLNGTDPQELQMVVATADIENREREDFYLTSIERYKKYQSDPRMTDEEGEFMGRVNDGSHIYRLRDNPRASRKDREYGEYRDDRGSYYYEGRRSTKRNGVRNGYLSEEEEGSAGRQGYRDEGMYASSLQRQYYAYSDEKDGHRSNRNSRRPYPDRYEEDAYYRSSEYRREREDPRMKERYGGRYEKDSGNGHSDDDYDSSDLSRRKRRSKQYGDLDERRGARYSDDEFDDREPYYERLRNSTKKRSSRRHGDEENRSSLRHRERRSRRDDKYYDDKGSVEQRSTFHSRDDTDFYTRDRRDRERGERSSRKTKPSYKVREDRNRHRKRSQRKGRPSPPAPTPKDRTASSAESSRAPEAINYGPVPPPGALAIVPKCLPDLPDVQNF